MTDRFSLIQKFTALFTLLAMIAPVSIIGVNAQMMQKTNAKSLTEDQKILHVLNRLGFRRAFRRCRKCQSDGIE